MTFLPAPGGANCPEVVPPCTRNPGIWILVSSASPGLRIRLAALQRRDGGTLRDSRATDHSARPLDSVGAALVVALCLSWGLNQVAIKLTLPDIPPLIQATIRSL